MSGFGGDQYRTRVPPQQHRSPGFHASNQPAFDPFVRQSDFGAQADPLQQPGFHRPGEHRPSTASHASVSHMSRPSTSQTPLFPRGGGGGAVGGPAHDRRAAAPSPGNFYGPPSRSVSRDPFFGVDDLRRGMMAGGGPVDGHSNVGSNQWAPGRVDQFAEPFGPAARGRGGNFAGAVGGPVGMEAGARGHAGGGPYGNGVPFPPQQVPYGGAAGGFQHQGYGGAVPGRAGPYDRRPIGGPFDRPPFPGAGEQNAYSGGVRRGDFYGRGSASGARFQYSRQGLPLPQHERGVFRPGMNGAPGDAGTPILPIDDVSRPGVFAPQMRSGSRSPSPSRRDAELSRMSRSHFEAGAAASSPIDHGRGKKSNAGLAGPSANFLPATHVHKEMQRPSADPLASFRQRDDLRPKEDVDVAPVVKPPSKELSIGLASEQALRQFLDEFADPAASGGSPSSRNKERGADARKGSKDRRTDTLGSHGHSKKKEHGKEKEKEQDSDDVTSDYSTDPEAKKALKRSMFTSIVLRVVMDFGGTRAKAYDLCEKYAGKENELYMRLCQKFAVHPSFFLGLETGLVEDSRYDEQRSPLGGGGRAGSSDGPASSIFGAAAAPPLSQPNSIFGAAPPSQPPASQQSIFGSAVPAASQSPKGRVFGAASGAAGSKSPKSTIFGASSGDAAGVATSARNIFGASATAATSSTNIFGPKAGSSQSEDLGAAANIFGVAPVASASASAIESAPASTNIFGVAPSVDMTKPLPAVPEEETLEMEDEGRSSPNKTDGPQQDQADDKAKPTAEDDEAMNNETKKVADAAATSAAASSPKSKMAQYICDNIREVYRKKNPKKIKTLAPLLEKYKGREMQLYKKVCAQYELPVEKTEADGTKKIIWYAVTDIDDTAEFKDEEGEGGDKGGSDAPASTSSTAAPAAPTTSIFGSTTGAAAGASIFGAKPAGGTSLFGAPAGTSTGAAAPSIFGAPGTSSGSLFGAPPASSGGLFGAPAGDAVKASEPKGIFGAATTTSGDGNATAPALGGIFGSSASGAAAPPSIFGSATTAPGAGDAKSAAASIFGVPSGVTGPPAATTITSSTSSNANGGGMKRTSLIFGADAAVDDGLDQRAKIASIFGSADPVKDVDEKTASKEIKLPGAGSKRKSIFEATSKNAGIFAPNPENSIFGKASSSGVLAEGESLFRGALSGPGSSGKNKKLSVSESKTGASVGGNAGIFGSLPQPAASTGGFNNIFSNTGSKSIFGNGKNAFGGATATERFGENLDGDTPPLEPFADANAAPAANPGTPVAAPTRKKRARDDAMDDEPAGGRNVAAVPGARRAKRAAAAEEPSSMAQGEESAPNPFKNVDFGGGANK
eukprot:g2585.t1